MTTSLARAWRRFGLISVLFACGSDPKKPEPCTDSCERGALECSSATPRVCRSGSNGCTVWVPATNECAPTCQNTCTEGATQCENGSLRSCTRGQDGCWTFGPGVRCASGQCADASACDVCVDACASESTLCENGAVRSCVRNERGCLEWSETTACPQGFCRDTESCGECSNTCARAGEVSCDTGRTRMCSADANGCLDWSSDSPCPSGFCGDARSCGSCNHTCPSDGATRCTNGSVETCVADAHGCRTWSAPTACSEGFCSDAASCGACTNTCARAGSVRCSEGSTEVCTADQYGCLSFGAPVACASGFCADATLCGECQNTCPSAGATECTAGQLRTCNADPQGCLRWSSPVTCGDGFCADEQSCGSCQHGCAPDETQCAGGAIRSCIADANGCRSFASPIACEDGFCADDATCGLCVDQCVLGASQCLNGQASTCVADVHGCLSWSAPVACPSGFCGDAVTCGSCQNDCVQAGVVSCDQGELRTCLGDIHGCLNLGPPTTCANGCRDATSCEPCAHECLGWGVACNGDVLETCVEDEIGCRKLLPRNCTLGCQADVCLGCTYTDPHLSSVLNDQSGWYEDLAFAGDVALTSWQERDGVYTRPGTGISAIDVSNPQSLGPAIVLPLSSSDSTRDLQVVGDRAYFLNAGGLEIYDVSNPSAPTRVGGLALPDTTSIKRGLSVDGTTAVIGADDGLHVIDLSTPSPTQRSRYQGIVTPYQVRLKGRYAVVSGHSRLQIVDLVDLQNPSVVADVSTPNAEIYRPTLVFDGARVFVTSYSSYNSQLWYQIDAFRFTPPSQLSRVGTLGGWSYVRALSLEGDTLAFSTGDSVGTIDVSTDTPTLDRRTTIRGGAAGVSYDGSTLLAVYDGLASYDLTKVSKYMTIPESDAISGAEVFGSIAYFARPAQGLVIEDIRDPAHPVVLSRTAMAARGLVRSGHHVFVAVLGTNNAELRSFDVTNPWRPVLRGTASVPRDAFGSNSIGRLRMEGARVYAICNVGSVCVFDVTNPATPTLAYKSDVISQTLPSQSSNSVYEVLGENLLLPEADELHVLDFRDPAAPTEIGAAVLPGYYGEVQMAVEGTLGVIVMPCHDVVEDLCLHTVDLATPTNPVVLGRLNYDIGLMRGLYDVYNSYGLTASLRVEGRYAYVSLQWGGVWIVDLADPTHPESVTELWTPYPARASVSFDRFLRAHVVSSFPYPQSPANIDQLIDLCAGTE